MTGNEFVAANKGTGAESSRLSELEQRLQANKRRREELLMEARGVSLKPELVTGGRASQEDRGKAGDAGSNERPEVELIEDNNSDDDELMNSTFERPPPVSVAAAAPVSRATSSRTREQSSPHRLSVAATSAAAHSTEAPGKQRRFSRPSRLESMEARIKRKSYCLRVNSPELARSNH